jgi:hypothetical protein
MTEVTRNKAEALHGRPAGQGFAGLVQQSIERAAVHAASISAGATGGLRASTPFSARCLRILDLAPIELTLREGMVTLQSVHSQ